MKTENQITSPQDDAQPRRDAEGARQLEAMEDRDPSVTLMCLKIATEFMASQPS